MRQKALFCKKYNSFMCYKQTLVREPDNSLLRSKQLFSLRHNQNFPDRQTTVVCETDNCFLWDRCLFSGRPKSLFSNKNNSYLRDKSLLFMSQITLFCEPDNCFLWTKRLFLRERYHFLWGGNSFQWDRQLFSLKGTPFVLPDKQLSERR